MPCPSPSCRAGSSPRHRRKSSPWSSRRLTCGVPGQAGARIGAAARGMRFSLSHRQKPRRSARPWAAACRATARRAPPRRARSSRGTPPARGKRCRWRPWGEVAHRRMGAAGRPVSPALRVLLIARGLWPSGADFATCSAAMAAPAPRGFPTRKGWPKAAARGSARTRAAMSAEPPMPKGAMIRADRSGQAIRARVGAAGYGGRQKGLAARTAGGLLPPAPPPRRRMRVAAQRSPCMRVTPCP
jgi:hypothetical protein